MQVVDAIYARKEIWKEYIYTHSNGQLIGIVIITINYKWVESTMQHNIMTSFWG